MAINSWLSPKITDTISECVPFLKNALTALLKMEPASISDVPEGAKRMTLPNSSQWKIEKYDGTNWVAAGKLMHDVDTVDGYHAAITPAKNTIAVRNSSGVLQDSITGNAATATKAVALSEINPVSMGGTGSNTAVGARTNLGVPPIAHASTANTYGLGTDTDYGHLKLSDSTSGTESVANGTAATPAAVKAVNDSAVHLTGDETIAGAKVFTSNPCIKYNVPTVCLINTDIEKGSASSSAGHGALRVFDKNGTASTGNSIGEFRCTYSTDGNCKASIMVQTPESGKLSSAEVSVWYPASGLPYATCPTPKAADGTVATSDDSTKIATTAWSHSAFDGKIAECVKSISGSKPDSNGNVNGVLTVNGVAPTSSGNITLGTAEGVLPVGSVIAFASGSVPDGYLICNGATVSRTTYMALFSVIGTIYGKGDGSTTFHLPDLTNRFIQGSDVPGTYRDAGLPNITGTLYKIVGYSGSSTDDGLILTRTQTGSVFSVGGGGYLNTIDLDASNSNQTYGRSDTVTPPSVTMVCCIKY